MHVRRCKPVIVGGILFVGSLLVSTSPAAADTVWEVTTYGNGELLKAAFQAIALFASDGLPSALKVAGIVALLSALIASLPGTLGSHQALMAIPNTALVAAIVGTLCSSAFHVQVGIVDRVALSTEMVAGVPLPIAIIGYVSSAFGERFAEKVEEAIYPVDYYGKFTETGLGWGPKVMQATLNANLVDMALGADLDAYIRLCVIPDIESGYKTPEKLLKARTADEILGDTNPAIPVLLPSQCDSNDLPQGCVAASDDQRCPDAYTKYLSPRLTQAASDSTFLNILGQQIGKTSATDVLPAIETVATDLMKASEGATDLLKLRFVANQFLPALQTYAALSGQNGLLTAWAASSSQAQQQASWINTGLLLQQILPFFHATLEFLFYAFLLFGIPLTIVTPRIFPQMLGNALWLQLWPLAYVFANRILYLQAEKVSLYSSDMNLGLSIWATAPIQDTFTYAYAASGFPVAIGVMLMGGMLFGGSYAMTKVVQHGPWGVGIGGYEAAAGNVQYGNMTGEQRTAAARTQFAGADDRGRPALIDAQGPPSAAIQTLTTGSGTTGLVAGSSENPFVSLQGQDGFSLTASTDSLVLRNPYLDYRQAQGLEASTRAGFAAARSHSLQSAANQSGALQYQVGAMASTLHNISSGVNAERAQTMATTLTRSSQEAAGRALGTTLSNRDLQSYGITNAGEAGGGVNLSFMGSGVNGRAMVRADFQDGTARAFELSETHHRQFQDSFARTMSQDSSLRKSLREGEDLIRGENASYSWQTGWTAMSTLSSAHAKEDAARQEYQQAATVSSALAMNREGDIGRGLWRDLGYEAAHGDIQMAGATPQGREALGRFLDHYRRLVTDPGQREQLAAFATQAMERDSLGRARLAKIQDTIATESAGIAAPATAATPPTPGAHPAPAAVAQAEALATSPPTFTSPIPPDKSPTAQASPSASSRTPSARPRSSASQAHRAPAASPQPAPAASTHAVTAPGLPGRLQSDQAPSEAALRSLQGQIETHFKNKPHQSTTLATTATSEFTSQAVDVVKNTPSTAQTVWNTVHQVWKTITGE